MQTRRKFDRAHEDIDEMILATEDAKDRAMLMILSNVADRLVQHEDNEVLMFQEAKRLMLVVAFFSNLVLGMFLWYGQGKLNEIAEIATVVANHTVKINRIEERHNIEARRP